MRVAELRWSGYCLPFRKPFSTATGTLAARRGYLIWIRDGDGRVGVGDAAPLPEFGGESPETAGSLLRDWAAGLPGAEADLSLGPAFSAPPAFGLLRTPPPAPAALHGLEQALLDLAAQGAGLPLQRLLHPTPENSVAVNATLAAGTPAEAERSARAALSAGFRTLKVKVGGGNPALDEARLEAVRAAAGSEVRLRIDANGSWEGDAALARLKSLQKFGLEYAEQPLPATDLEGMARLVRLSPVPIAADEAVSSEAEAHRILRAGAANVLVLKPMMVGGIPATLRIARAAQEAGVPAVVTTSLESAVGRLGALHAASVVDAMHREAGLPLPPPAHGLATGSLLAADVTPATQPAAGGRMKLPQEAGLGISCPMAESVRVFPQP